MTAAGRAPTPAQVTVDFSPATSAALNVACRSEVEAERDRLRRVLETVLADIDENYRHFIGLPLLVRNSTIEAIRSALGIDAALPEQAGGQSSKLTA